MSKRNSQRCKHNRAICSECIVVTDDGKRVADATRLAVVFHSWEELATGWMAFALADGATDHVIYPSRESAIAHQSDEQRFMFVAMRTCPMGIPERDAEIILAVHREAYDAGMGFTEPQAPSVIMPVSRGVGKWPQ